ncbi:MAG: hypothetical protein ABIP54_01625 [Candidatus Andersenbacteria bacterium]
MNYTFFLGTNPILSTSEIEAFFARMKTQYEITRSKPAYLRITADSLPDHMGSFLGGTIRITKDITSWHHMPSAQEIVNSLAPLPEKWVLGLSVLSGSVSVKKLAIEIKKSAKAHGSKLSFIEPKGSSLNAAQVLFNRLTHEPNMDLSIIRIDQEYILIKTIHMQNIANYELRDTSRPARDARVGLLPPKLAQIMINLAQPNPDTTIYDPFCGMGTILQESWNMGFSAIGSDSSERMVEASKTNLNWMSSHFPVLKDKTPEVFLHDVREEFPEHLKEKTLFVVTEPFLGTPLTHPLSSPEIDIFHNGIMELYREFFKNIRNILKPGSNLLILMPCPKGQEGFTPLPRTFIDEITAIGYRKKQLASREEPVLYARPDALVAREVTLWEAL